MNSTFLWHTFYFYMSVSTLTVMLIYFCEEFIPNSYPAHIMCVRHNFRVSQPVDLEHSI
jgi:hypothetical protein